jgi:hypothetical protein
VKKFINDVRAEKARKAEEAARQAEEAARVAEEARQAKEVARGAEEARKAEEARVAHIRDLENGTRTAAMQALKASETAVLTAREAKCAIGMAKAKIEKVKEFQQKHPHQARFYKCAEAVKDAVLVEPAAQRDREHKKNSI